LILFGIHAIASLPDGLWDSRPLAIVSLSEATEDIEAFFEAMRSLYPGYMYFGGDAVFLPWSA